MAVDFTLSCSYQPFKFSCVQGPDGCYFVYTATVVSVNVAKHLACSTWYTFFNDTVTEVDNLEGVFGKLATSQHHPRILELLNEIVDCHLTALKNSSIMY